MESQNCLEFLRNQSISVDNSIPPSQDCSTNYNTTYNYLNLTKFLCNMSCSFEIRNDVTNMTFHTLQANSLMQLYGMNVIVSIGTMEKLFFHATTFQLLAKSDWGGNKLAYWRVN